MGADPLTLAMIASAVVGTGAAAKSMLTKVPQMQAPKVPSRNDAAEAVQRGDRAARRRGVAANLLLGAQGAESSTGGKSALGT